MIIHHIRNAAMLIETEEHGILVDPMLGQKGETGHPFTLFRFKPLRNPIVDLPPNVKTILDKTTHCLITHLHPDHLDKAGIEFLKSNNIPIICSIKDEATLRKKGLNIFQTVNYWQSDDFLGGTIEGIPAKHGYGFVSKLMGNVMGFYIKLPNEPSIYLSSDTIYTEAVDKVLKTYKPNISIVAAGTAQLDLFQPLLMTMDDIVKFTKSAPGKVIANHLEAVNHCPTSRNSLISEMKKQGLSDKIYIPKDGETITFH